MGMMIHRAALRAKAAEKAAPAKPVESPKAVEEKQERPVEKRTRRPRKS